MPVDWEQLRADLEIDAGKQSQDVTYGLERAYASLGSDDRAVVNAILVKWLLSNDSKKRYDARVLAWRFHILEMKDALLELAERLRAEPSALARHERELVCKIIAQFERTA